MYANPGRLGLLGAPTYPMLRDPTQTTLLQVMDEHGLPFELNKSENTLVAKDINSRVIFRPADEVERLRGTNLAWFGLDELTYTHEAAWLRLEGRLRDPLATELCGFAVWTPKGYDWVYRKFVMNGGSQDYGLVFAKPHENHYLLEKVPDFYDRLKGSYDETFYQQEVLGLYINSRGNLVYRSFTREQNVKDLQPVARVPLLWTLDFNVDPMSSLVVQITNGEVHVLDEIVLRHATTQQACEEFLRRFPQYDGTVVVYGDASGHREQTTGASDYEIVKDYLARETRLNVRYRLAKSNPAVRDRVVLTNSKLCSASGEVGLFVDPKCKELIQDFEEVCFREDSGAQIDKDQDRLRTHLSDALGYLLWQECAPKKPSGERGKPLLC